MYKYIHIQTYMYTYIHTHTHTYTHFHTHTHTHSYTHTYIHIHTHIYTFTHTHVHIYIYTYIHIYINKHIHTIYTSSAKNRPYPQYKNTKTGMKKGKQCTRTHTSVARLCNHCCNIRIHVTMRSVSPATIKRTSVIL